MEQKCIEKTHINMCRLVLGTDYYGKTIPEEDAYRLMDLFCDRGGSLIDTAHVYSDYLPGEKHMSEKVIGRWLKRIGNAGKGIYVATKGGFPEIGDMHASRLSYKNVKSDLDESLECLQKDCIDLYWLHRDNKEIPVGEMVHWMNDFLKTGKIKSYGFSNWNAGRIEEAQEFARKNGLEAPSASQIRWSIAETNIASREDDTLVDMDLTEYVWYKKSKMPVFAFSSQAKGFFAKLCKRNGEYIPPDGKAGKRYFNEKNIKKYETLLPICQKYGMSIMQGSLVWLLNAPFKVFPIVGSKTLEQLEDSMKAASFIGKIEEFVFAD